MFTSVFASNIEKTMLKEIAKNGLMAGIKYYSKHIGKKYYKKVFYKYNIFNNDKCRN